MFPYESNYVCHFFRLWGNLEAASGTQLGDSLLGNMQNDFDAKFGDVCGDANNRFFFIEFKRSRKGFSEEVSKSGKAHRAALYEHLRSDSSCRQIARQGHFGCYPDRAGNLVFEPYAHCPAEIKTKLQITHEVLGATTPINELDYQGWDCNFPKFYEQITNYDSSMSENVSGFFASGLGISAEHLREYVSCMYQHLQTKVDSSGTTVLGAFNSKTNKFVAFNDTIEGLFSRLQSALNSPKEWPGISSGGCHSRRESEA